MPAWAWALGQGRLNHQEQVTGLETRHRADSENRWRVSRPVTYPRPRTYPSVLSCACGPLPTVGLEALLPKVVFGKGNAAGFPRPRYPSPRG